MQLYNKLSAEERAELTEQAGKKRLTLSFYAYANIENPKEFRNHLFIEWNKLEALGRIYVANEGINAQMSVPAEKMEAFRETLERPVGRDPLRTRNESGQPARAPEYRPSDRCGRRAVFGDGIRRWRKPFDPREMARPTPLAGSDSFDPSGGGRPRLCALGRSDSPRVKPSNLMLTPGGVVKLLDLGLTLSLKEDDSGETRLGDSTGDAPSAVPI